MCMLFIVGISNTCSKNGKSLEMNLDFFLWMTKYIMKTCIASDKRIPSLKREVNNRNVVNVIAR